MNKNHLTIQDLGVTRKYSVYESTCDLGNQLIIRQRRAEPLTRIVHEPVAAPESGAA